MMKRLLLLALLLPIPTQLGAQESLNGERAGRGGWGALRVSKWATLAATLGATVYGLTTIRGADDDYEHLELACQQAPAQCRRRSTDGSYLDEQLELQYQSVLGQDRRARTALLASQIGAVATVVLFVLDLRHARGPADIPYQPPRGLELKPTQDGVELRLTVPAR